jgi:mycothiol synthase
MPITYEPWGVEQIPVIRALMEDPALAHEFESIRRPRGIEYKLADPFQIPALRWLARRDGEPVAYAYGMVVPDPAGAWSMVRIGVTRAHQRQGVGSALLERCVAHLETLREAKGLREVCLSSWEPNEGAPGFAARHGFVAARNYWEMERAPGTPDVEWPAGIEVTTFDGSDRMLEAWNDAYNQSFAEHYHYVLTSAEERRRMHARADFHPEGLVLAWRGGRCVGFSYNALTRDPTLGEVALLGVVPEVRGIGLGRAVLRWSVAWLSRAGANPVKLLVDGDNPNALALYRSEGFEVTRTRVIWSRPAAAPSTGLSKERAPRSASSSIASSP